MIFSEKVWMQGDAYSTIHRIQRAKDELFAHKACEGTELNTGNTK